LAALLRRVVAASGLVLPYFIPIVFYLVYQPINEGWTVKQFGCGCPTLDGKYHFNANDFNLVIVAVIALFCVPWWLVSASQMTPKKIRIPVCFFGTLIILFISLEVWGKMVWF
jgi:hypothetical protein